LETLFLERWNAARVSLQRDATMKTAIYAPPEKGLPYIVL